MKQPYRLICNGGQPTTFYFPSKRTARAFVERYPHFNWTSIQPEKVCLIDVVELCRSLTDEIGYPDEDQESMKDVLEDFLQECRETGLLRK